LGETLFNIDLSVFYFINHSIQNIVFDVLMPFITDLNKKPVILVVVVIAWLWMIVRGGSTGRMAGIVLVLTIAFSDQLNSSWIKHIFDRDRPCHVLTDVHLLVSCGSGYSFPSSHAVNNFAGAIVLSYYYRPWTWAFMSFASVVSLSRVYVGVHYPSDVVAGAIVGILCGAFVLAVVHWLENQWTARHSGTRESAP